MTYDDLDRQWADTYRMSQAAGIAPAERERLMRECARIYRDMRELRWRESLPYPTQVD